MQSGTWRERLATRLHSARMSSQTEAAVSSVGDEAFALTAANVTTRYVKKGSTVFIVRVYGMPDPGCQLALEKPIAQAVAPKI